MDTIQNRMDYISTVPEEGYGATCIGCGLLEGMQVTNVLKYSPRYIISNYSIRDRFYAMMALIVGL